MAENSAWARSMDEDIANNYLMGFDPKIPVIQESVNPLTTNINPDLDYLQKWL